MSNTPAVIDISNMPDLLELAEEVDETKKPRVLKHGNRTVALLSPLSGDAQNDTAETEVVRQSLAAIGSWHDLAVADILDRLAQWRKEGSRPLTRPSRPMDYLLDTSWMIQVLGGKGAAVAIHKNLNLARVAVSIIAVGEIYEVAFAYANPTTHLESFRQFLAPFRVLTLTEPIMEQFAQTRAFLRRRGELISDFDILIGATAIVHNLTLLTYNTRHFQRIPDIKLYPLP